MLATLFIALQALALTSASVVQKRQDGGVATNIPSQATVDEPARGEDRRILVWGREDLALTVLGDPAAGTAVGIAYALPLDDTDIGRQLYDVNLHDDDDEPNQFDYNDDDDELRLRGTQLCVTMSTPGTLTLETCDDSRDDDRNWIQDWEFDDQDRQDWVRIEDDDDDSRCLTASLGQSTSDQAQLTVEQCSNDNVNQRFYQVLPGTGAGSAPSGSAVSSNSASSTSTPAGTPISSANDVATSNASPSGTNAPAGTTTPNASRPRVTMWGQGIFRYLASLQIGVAV